jgi:hypothetical protein
MKIHHTTEEFQAVSASPGSHSTPSLFNASRIAPKNPLGAVEHRGTGESRQNRAAIDTIASRTSPLISYVHGGTLRQRTETVPLLVRGIGGIPVSPT